MKRREFVRRLLGSTVFAPLVLEQGLGSATLGAGDVLTAEDVATVAGKFEMVDHCGQSFGVVVHPSHEKELERIVADMAERSARFIDREIARRL